jgi:hypothetical protein
MAVVQRIASTTRTIDDFHWHVQQLRDEHGHKPRDAVHTA